MHRKFPKWKSRSTGKKLEHILNRKKPSFYRLMQMPKINCLLDSGSEKLSNWYSYKTISSIWREAQYVAINSWPNGTDSTGLQPFSSNEWTHIIQNILTDHITTTWKLELISSIQYSIQYSSDLYSIVFALVKVYIKCILSQTLSMSVDRLGRTSSRTSGFTTGSDDNAAVVRMKPSE